MNKLRGVSSQASEERNFIAGKGSLIERLVERSNMSRAYARVMRNKGAAGIDKMPVEKLKDHLKEQWPRIKAELLEGRYTPKPVRRKDIPKPGGGVRQLGIPTAVDRLIQQALQQILNPIFEPGFSDFSFGFRVGRNAHQAILQAKRYQGQGRRWVVDMDLEKFFDRVNHDKLMARVAKKVKDKEILKLIRSHLNAGIMHEGITTVPEAGTPQGSPLSPLLSNIVLDDLDKELEKRGHTFCRYADDCNIYVRSEKAGHRVLESITQFVEKKLKLKINKGKSAVDQTTRRHFLGYSYWDNEGEIKIRVPEVSVQKLKSKLKEVFRQGRGRNLTRFIQEDLNPILRGWISYFKLAETSSFSELLDKWIRRRLRLILWRQWKRGWTRRKKLIQLGVREILAVMSAFNSRGPWYNSGHGAMLIATPIAYFNSHGLVQTLKKLRQFQTG